LHRPLQYGSADSIAGRRLEQIWVDVKEAWLMNIASEDFGAPLNGSGVATGGEFAGWHTWPRAVFESNGGPFHFRHNADGRIRCAFRAGKGHLNGGQHGQRLSHDLRRLL